MTRMLLWVSALLFVPTSIAADMPLNLTRGVTEISNEVYDLHMLIFYICCVIGLLVFGAMFIAMYKHRKSKGAVAAKFHESVKVEVLWTLIPFLILIGMAIPATQTLIKMEDPSDSDLTILVTGSQWKWHYKYLDQDIEFYSVMSTTQDEISNKADKGEHYLLEVDKPLVIPTNKKVRFLMTSDDVIHSWWVPAFAVKKDANPGFINEAWTRVDKAGTYRGQCAELCGKDHGFMPVVVEAVPPEEFDSWVVAQLELNAQAAAQAAADLNKTLSMDELMSQGQSVYLANCAACHQENGKGIPGVFPSLIRSPVINGDIAKHIDIVVNGVSGTSMAAFGSQLTDTEIAAVVTYERNAWGNNKGDSAQAADVAGVEPAVVVEPEVQVAQAEAKPAEPLAPLTMESAMAEGEKVYLAKCSSCHLPTGTGVAGAFPSLIGSPVIKGPASGHINVVVKGVAGTGMMPFASQLSPREIAAVVTYERNAWGNNSGELVTEEQVQAQSGQ
ncbi:cytochrome c oxidase subunit II [Paraferrimonas sp. SM1919]|uniref:cytochrome c oxidase subunit II n=1 Tax=Paraferrimonas sp. SM1919 TaxID=2662263 RepID=UPI0013D7371B|nr:cytochrome c oxidase subunit II [Paraferrimonas sp. SM1919]